MSSLGGLARPIATRVAVGAAENIGITLALAAFTAGIGAVAGAAKIAVTITLWAKRIKGLIDKLKALTRIGSIGRQLATRAAMGAAENVVIGMGTTYVMDIQDGKLDANYGAVLLTSVIAGGAGGAASGVLARVLPDGTTLSQAVKFGALDGMVNGSVSGAVANMSNSVLTGSEFNPLSGAFWGTITGGIGGAAGGGIEFGFSKLDSSPSTTTPGAPGAAPGAASSDTPTQVTVPTSLSGEGRRIRTGS